MDGDLDTLLADLRRLAADGNAGWTTLPPAAFRSDALFALEKERVFAAGWICVGRADQVAKPGDYMALDVVGEPIVLVRDLEGRLRVLSNLCRHRWMSVCLGAGNAKVLSCPYHAWTYRLDGSLWAAPAMTDHPTFDKAKVALPQIRHEVWQGFVYVNLDGRAAPLGPQLVGLDARIAAYDLATWVTAATRDCGEYPWDWKVMQDNGECYHHLGLHTETFEVNYPGRWSGTWEQDGIFTFLWSPSRPEKRVQGADGLDYVPAMEFPPMAGLDELQRTSFLLLFVLPNFFIYLQPDLVMNMRVFPLAAGRIRLFADFIVRPEARALPDFQARLDRVIAFFDRFNDEDVIANSAIQRNLGSRFAAAAPLSSLEHHNRHVARWLARQVAG